MYARERQAELDSVSDGREEEEYRKAVVAEARRRLLEEHARRLDGFLPKGALQNQEEAKIFRSAAVMNNQTNNGNFYDTGGYQQQEQSFNNTQPAQQTGGYDPSVTFQGTDNYGNASQQQVGY